VPRLAEDGPPPGDGLLAPRTGTEREIAAAEVADLERQLEEARKLLAEQDGQEGGGS